MASDMAGNSSSTSGLLFHECLHTTVGLQGTSAFFIVRSFLSLPLCAIILHLGYHQWWQQHSFKAASHSDVFTYHMVAMDLIWVLVGLSFFIGSYADITEVKNVGIVAASFIFYGEVFFHILTSVDRYLAIVHPITYLRLKGERGAQIRNLSIGCVWILCSVSLGVTIMYIPDFPLINLFCAVVFSLIVVSFCSISSLYVLIRPGPGDGGGQKDHVDQSKQRAFLTIVAILAVLWLWFAGLFVFLGLYTTTLLSQRDTCVAVVCANWCNLPSSLVLPLLFLHRAGKLPCG